jgi:Domain of unknown function (DUF4389)
MSGRTAGERSLSRVAHPVRLVVRDDLRRTRITVLLRLPLALPHLALGCTWLALTLAALPFQWLHLLVRARPARALEGAAARGVRYGVAVAAYVLLLADPRPPLRQRPYPIELVLSETAQSQRRAGVLLRPALALPAVVFASVLTVVAGGVAVAGWFAALTAARLPPGLEELGTYCLRFCTQTLAYVLLLTESYPSLEGEPVTAASGARR